MATTVAPEIIKIVEKLTGRAKKVCDYIIANGYITTEIIEKDLNYGHGPRAVRDVRESGIPIKTIQSKDSSGKRCARYEFGEPSEIIEGRHQGRTQFPKKFKESLYVKQSSKCAITGVKVDIRYLQVDHRVPYQVQGDSHLMNLKEDDYMLITGECQRQKSWSCEQCENFKVLLDKAICEKCYWANPNSYDHSECKAMKRIFFVYENKEAEILNQKIAKLSNEELKDLIFKKISDTDSI